MATIEIRLLTGTKTELADIQRVIEEAPDFARRSSGSQPGPTAGRDLFNDLAPGKTPADRFVFGVYQRGDMVGCAHLMRGYPGNHSAMLGLLLISENHQRRGIGREAYKAIEDYIVSWPECTVVRIGVLQTNDIVLPFWNRLGFVETGETDLYEEGAVRTRSIVLEKTIR